MRRIVASLVLGCMVALLTPALGRAAENAEHVTNEPAATLLLPYFEAQVPAKIGGKGKGINTLFSINNASASSALAHVTIWSDLGIPVINFDLYLTGYDVVRISMQDILNGIFPVTADAGSDPGNSSPPGASCPRTSTSRARPGRAAASTPSTTSRSPRRASCTSFGAHR